MRRLTFTYSDGEIELISQQTVEMRVPAVSRDGEAAFRGEAAALPSFWYELRGDGDEALYRIAAPDPIPDDVEVFSPDSEENIARSPEAPKEGVFTILLPEIEGAEEVRLMRAADAGEPSRDVSPRTEASIRAEAVEVARFNLPQE